MPKPLITSLLDTDLYKFTMMQCVMHQFPHTPVGYRLILRKPFDLRPYQAMIQEQIHALCDLRFQKQELDYLTMLGYFTPDFIEYLSTFSLSEKHISMDPSYPDLHLTIEGPWQETILFEIPLLALISEIVYQKIIPTPDYQEGRQRLQRKIHYFKHHAPLIALIEFGTRRRFSYAWQQEVIDTLHVALPDNLIGTSNVYFAHQFSLRPIGTMAHEYLQACQVLAPHIQGCQHFALTTWLKEYPLDLLITLTDSLTMDVFLREFDYSLATRYEGLRHDSGDPIVWGEKALAHYRALGIDPRAKTFVFSDNLTSEKAVAIHHYFQDQCHPMFGIGTHLTNDLGYTPLDIVLKMVHACHRPVIKVTDSPGKTVCDDPAYLEYVKTIFEL